MRIGSVSLLVTCASLALVLLVSCAPATSPTPTATLSPTLTATATPSPTTTAPVTKGEPQYGGTINEPWIYSQMAGFEPSSYAMPMRFAFGVYEGLAQEDWARGPSGTKELPLSSGYTPMEGYAGALAESWEQPDLTTIIFHIRKGVHFQNKPPVNGREMTADDIVYSFNRTQSFEGSEWYVAPDKPEQRIIATAVDKWTVEFKFPQPDVFMPIRLARDPMIFPHEVVDQYGDFNDWRNACGTGPWIVKDVVSGSSITYIKNTDYWQYDPFHPKNKLPYADSMRLIFVTDLATQLAALRTGRIDRLQGVLWEDANRLKQDSPALLYRQLPPTGTRLGPMRIENPPLNDKRVRQALMYAINWDDMVNNFYGGSAEKLTWPLMSTAIGVYTPPEQLPENFYSYQSDKAKALLSAAGYPNGFKLNVITQQVYVDQAQLIKAYWEKVGIIAEIDVKEAGAHWSMEMSHTFPMMSMGGWGNSQPWLSFDTAYKKDHIWNTSRVDDPSVEKTWADIKNTLDVTERNTKWKQLNLYLIDQMYYLNFPAPATYTFWQPWLKGYNGEFEVGRLFDYVGGLTYTWLDLNTKKTMIGRE
jgi:peptide/nickel transport system substrate-binding protein